jgi:L-asparaginase/Glu-tRNA(Gln) amidotransferase subunit D
VVFYQAPTRTHTLDAEFDVAEVAQLPQVDIAYAYAGADGRVVQALAGAGAAGIVAAGLGSGGSPRAFMEALKQAQRQGVKVVIATQTGNGRVMRTQRFDEDGYLLADNLSPKKARILLMLALTRTQDRAEIQRMMWTY